MSECEECGKETSHLICEQCFEDYKTIREETSRALVYEYKLRVEAEKERDEMKELLAECAYSKHTQEAMSQEMFDRICKALEKEAGR